MDDRTTLTADVGDVYSLMLGSKTLIVLSSDVAVKELLDRRSATYSDRPELYIGQELCSGGLRMLMMVSLAIPRSAKAMLADIYRTALRTNVANGKGRRQST